MDFFYKPDSNVLGDLVEKLKPSFEHSPERKDYEMQNSKFGNISQAYDL